MRVIVAGAVAWDDRALIRSVLSELPSGSTVIHGDSPGADRLGGEVARALGLEVLAMAKNKNDRKRYGRGAWKGLNERMLAAGAERVLVFHPKIEASRGSKHLAKLAEAAGVEVQVYDGAQERLC